MKYICQSVPLSTHRSIIMRLLYMSIQIQTLSWSSNLSENPTERRMKMAFCTHRLGMYSPFYFSFVYAILDFLLTISNFPILLPWVKSSRLPSHVCSAPQIGSIPASGSRAQANQISDTRTLKKSPMAENNNSLVVTQKLSDILSTTHNTNP